MSGTDQITEGKAAWQRLRERERKSWSDWLLVGEALLLLRAKAMATAQANRPMGSRYNAAFGSLLRQHGFDGISGQERYRAIQVIEHRADIEAWRNALPETKRRHMNHPGACWHAWRRETRPPMPRQPRQMPNPARTRNNYPCAIHWSQDRLRAASVALAKLIRSGCSDSVVMAKTVLETAVTDRNDLLDLLDGVDANWHPRKPAAAAVEPALHA